nr:hypothetical protein NG677_04255 [Methylobacterium sp. OTU13CASTA1]
MTDDTKSREELQALAGNSVMADWRDALGRATEDAGEQLASTGMLMVAIEGVRELMGTEGAADFLEAMARTLRTGEDITVTIDPKPNTEH